MTQTARFQVVEVPHGYAVKDSRSGSIWTKTYRTVGWAAKKAAALNEAHQPGVRRRYARRQ